MQDETSRETRVSHGLVGKVCGGRWNSESFGREARSVPYILCTYRASLVSNVSRDRACETRPRSRGLVSRLVSQGLAARRNSIKKSFWCFYVVVCTHSSILFVAVSVFSGVAPAKFCWHRLFAGATFTSKLRQQNLDVPANFKMRQQNH